MKSNADASFRQFIQKFEVVVRGPAVAAAAVRDATTLKKKTHLRWLEREMAIAKAVAQTFG